MGCGESDQRKGNFPPSKRKSSAWSLDTQHGSGERKLGQQEYRSNSIEEWIVGRRLSLSISRLAVRSSRKLFDCIGRLQQKRNATRKREGGHRDKVSESVLVVRVYFFRRLELHFYTPRKLADSS